MYRRAELVEQYRERVRQSADTLRSLSEVGTFWSAAAQHAAERAAVWDARAQVGELELQIARLQAGAAVTATGSSTGSSQTCDAGRRAGGASSAGSTESGTARSESEAWWHEPSSGSCLDGSSGSSSVSSDGSSVRERIWRWLRHRAGYVRRWLGRPQQAACKHDDTAPIPSPSMSTQTTTHTASAIDPRPVSPQPGPPQAQPQGNTSQQGSSYGSPSTKTAEAPAVAAAAAALAISQEAAAHWEAWRARCDGKVKEVLQCADEVR